MKRRRAVLTAVGAVVMLAMAGVAIRYSGMLRDVPMLAIMAGYTVGAVSAWLAAMDWIRATVEQKNEQGGQS